jgi:anti-anti-sigma regulatory factor
MARKTSVTLSLGGSLTIQQAEGVLDLLRKRFAEGKAKLSVSLENISACDTAGLQLLCAARQSALLANRPWQPAKPSSELLRACTDTAITPAQIGL